MVLLCLVLSPAAVSALDTAWKRYTEAGLSEYQQGRYAEAEQMLLAALREAERFGSLDLRLAVSCNNLALLYQAHGKYAEVEALLRRAIAIGEKALGAEHPTVATSLENYAALLRKTNREAEAASMESRAQAIRAKRAQKKPTM